MDKQDLKTLQERLSVAREDEENWAAQYGLEQATAWVNSASSKGLRDERVKRLLWFADFGYYHTGVCFSEEIARMPEPTLPESSFPLEDLHPPEVVFEWARSRGAKAVTSAYARARRNIPSTSSMP